MNFNELTTTKLGTVAEQMLINEFVKGKGYIPYTPSVDESHPIDAICMAKGKKTWALDVKAKSRRKYYEDTGIDTADYNAYMDLDMPVYLLFADILQGKAYGGWLNKLPAKQEGSITYFPLSAMTDYRELTQIEQTTLMNYERSNYYK